MNGAPLIPGRRSHFWRERTVGLEDQEQREKRHGPFAAVSSAPSLAHADVETGPGAIGAGLGGRYRGRRRIRSHSRTARAARSSEAHHCKRRLAKVTT